MREIRRKFEDLGKTAWVWSTVLGGACISAQAAGPVRAPEAVNQSQAQVISYQANDYASDESLRSSTVFAMQALMDLAATKLPSAMKNGYSAYGKYRNAENLDRLKDKNAAIANSLTSAGSEPVLKVPRKTNTSFRRIDGKFLREGEAGRVAAEFERQTGMKREEFLKQMAEISEQKIKRSDPMMIDKALARFEGFLKKIPNAEFRKNAEKSVAMVPNTMRRGMVGQAVQKLAGFFADAGGQGSASHAFDSSISALQSNSLAGSSGTGTTPSGTANSVAELDPKPNAFERQPAAEQTSAQEKAPQRAKTGKDGFSGIVVAALSEHRRDVLGDAPIISAEPTIFQQISRRYRLLTPQVAQVPSGN